MPTWKRSAESKPSSDNSVALLKPSSAWFRIDPYGGDDAAAAAGNALAFGDWTTFDSLFRSRDDVNLQASLLHGTLNAHAPDTVLDAWVNAEPGNYVALLARGARGIRRAWEIRGSGRASTVNTNAMQHFWATLIEAEHDLGHAADLNNDDPISWGEMLRSGRGLQISNDDLWLRWEQIEHRAPHLGFAHDQMLQSMCKKWSGSHEAMFDFARSRTQGLPDGHPLHRLIAVAHFERFVDSKKLDSYRRDASNADEIVESARRSALTATFGDTPDHRLTRNWFALTTWLFKRTDAGRPLIEGLESCLTEHPWAYYESGAAFQFRKMQLRAGVTPKLF